MATDFTSQITAIYQAVEYRNPPAAELAVYNAALQSGSMTIAQVQSAVINDPFTSTVVDAVIREYQAAFNRVPDQAGVSYWVNAIASNPAVLPQLNTIFANSAEFTARFGATATTPANSALVTSLYTNVYGRAPDQAGLTYWSNSGLNAAQLLQAFANAQEFVTQTTPAIQAFQQAEIAGTAPTTGSLFAIVPPNVPGSTLALTAGIDALTGTAGNDTFVGDNSNPNLLTVTASDSLNGGAGNDTFNYFSPTTGVLPQLNSIENVNLIGGAAVTENFTSAVGLQQVTIKAPTAGGDVITLNSGVAAGLDKVVGAFNETFVYQSSTTSASLNVANGTNDTGTIDLQGAAITTLSVNSTGGKNTIGTLTDSTAGAAVKTLNITGDSALTINNLSGTLTNSLTTIDASKDTGGVKIGTQLANGTTFTGGAGNDEITLGANTNAINMGAGNDTVHLTSALGTGGAVDGGAGTNTIGLSAANAVAFSANTTFEKTISNFQQLSIDTAVTNATGTIDLHNLNDINYVKMAAGVVAANAGSAGTAEVVKITLSDLAAGQSETVAGHTYKNTNAAGTITAGAIDDWIAGGETAGTTPAGLTDTLDNAVSNQWTLSGDGVATNGVIKATANSVGADNASPLVPATGPTGTTLAESEVTAGTNAVPATLAGTVTLNNYTSGGTLELDAANNGDVTAVIKNAGASTSDVFNIVLNGADGLLNAGTVHVANVETINVTTGVSGTAAPTQAATLNLDITSATNLNVSGNHGVDFTGSQLTALTTFDASGVTATGAVGAVKVATTATNLNVSLTGGAGNDTLDASSITDVTKVATINGGAGNDTIKGGAGADVLTGGAGADTFVYGGNSLSNGTHVDTITDFTTKVDKIDVSAMVTGGGVGGALSHTGTYAGDASSYGTVLTSLVAGTHVAVLDTSTNTLYVDVNADGALTSADLAIKLTGVTHLNTGDIIF